MKEKMIMSWSGGKDSCLALHEIRCADEIEVVSLVTTIIEDFQRVSMHGVRRELLEAQCRSIGIELDTVMLSAAASCDEYVGRVGEVYRSFLPGVKQIVFGDLFLQDLRDWREEKLAAIGMRGHYPIWARDTKELAKFFIDEEYKAILVCVDGEKLDASFAGRQFDAELLADLPGDVDWCGENGEFHTFVYDGPIFNSPLRVRCGERVTRGRFHYCDLAEMDDVSVASSIGEFAPPVLK